MCKTGNRILKASSTQAGSCTQGMIKRAGEKIRNDLVEQIEMQNIE